MTVYTNQFLAEPVQGFLQFLSSFIVAAILSQDRSFASFDGFFSIVFSLMFA